MHSCVRSEQFVYAIFLSAVKGILPDYHLVDDVMATKSEMIKVRPYDQGCYKTDVQKYLPNCLRDFDINIDKFLNEVG